MSRRMFSLIGSGLVLSLMFAHSSNALEISDDQQIDGESPQIVGDGAGHTIKPSGISPNWSYSWADRNGDDSGVGVAQAGLNLGTHKLYTAVMEHRGTITLDLNGGDIVGTGEIAVITSPAIRNTQSDNLTISNVRDMAIGQILTYARGTSSGKNSNAVAGDLSIGSESNPARHLRIASIHTGDHTIGTRSGAKRGNVVVYATGNVLIEDANGNLGDIRTHSGTEPKISGRGTPGHVSITHKGTFRVNDIISHMGRSSTTKNPAVITLNGGSSEGDCIVRDIDNRHYASGYGSSERGLVNIRNYANVVVRNINSSHPFTDPERMGGHVEINDIAGKIDITGEIDCSCGHNYLRTKEDYGHVKLSAGGKITLAKLDIGKVQFALLNSGDSLIVVDGELDNFNPTFTGGTGTEDDPLVTTQIELRVPAGQKILYNIQATQSLAGLVYRLADQDGQPGQGGLLAPNPNTAIVVVHEPREEETGNFILSGTLISSGLSPATVSVYWAEGSDRGTDPEAWPHTKLWKEHSGSLPAEYAHAIAVQPDAHYIYRFAVSNAEGKIWTKPQSIARTSNVVNTKAVRLARWLNDADAAVSFTWDDNNASARAIASLFNEFGWKTSFFVNPGISASWEALKNIFADISREGHEIGNHTYKHSFGGSTADMILQIERANEEIEAVTGIFPVSFVHPNNNRNNAKDGRVFERHLVARITSPYGMDGRLIQDSPGSLQLFQRDLDKITTKGSLMSGGWLLLGGHGMNYDGYNPLKDSELRAIFDDINARPEKIWVGTMGEVGIYESVFKTVSLAVESVYDTITVRVTGFEVEKYTRASKVPITVVIPLRKPLDVTKLSLNPSTAQAEIQDDRLLVTFDLKKTTVLRVVLDKSLAQSGFPN